MCFNAPVSLITYIIGSVFSILLILRANKQDKILGYFFLFVSQMQLFEYIFWKNQECNIINKTITIIAAYFNHLQPFILYLAICYYYKNININLHIIALIYLITSIVYTIYSLKNVKCTLADCPDSKHLYWKWNSISYGWIFYIFYLLFFIILLYLYIEPYIAIIVIISYIISYIIYYKEKSIGALWCFFAALFPFLYYIKQLIFFRWYIHFFCNYLSTIR